MFALLRKQACQMHLKLRVSVLLAGVARHDSFGGKSSSEKWRKKTKNSFKTVDTGYALWYY